MSHNHFAPVATAGKAGTIQQGKVTFRVFTGNLPDIRYLTAILEMIDAT